jgi:putative Mn2+ efflux pump MntP
MDAFSVSITHGLANKFFKPTNALKLGTSFGFFQGIVPILGWLAGVSINARYEKYSPVQRYFT